MADIDSAVKLLSEFAKNVYTLTSMAPGTSKAICLCYERDETEREITIYVNLTAERQYWFNNTEVGGVNDALLVLSEVCIELFKEAVDDSLNDDYAAKTKQSPEFADCFDFDNDNLSEEYQAAILCRGPNATDSEPEILKQDKRFLQRFIFESDDDEGEESYKDDEELVEIFPFDSDTKFQLVSSSDEPDEVPRVNNEVPQESNKAETD